MEEINRFSTASLITRSTNDITQIQMIIAMGLQVMIKAPLWRCGLFENLRQKLAVDGGNGRLWYFC